MPVYRPNMNTVLNLRERPTEAIAHERWSTPPLTSRIRQKIFIMAAPNQFFSLNFNGADPASPFTCPHCQHENPVDASMCKGHKRGKPCCWVVPIVSQAHGNDEDGTSDANGGKS
ncbi:unnamed protein product [Fusarium fujikuroi]|nr:unnamed protein product [Fusarium fujikuroi]